MPASADTLGPYTDLLVFGDSLSDPGNVFELTGGAYPDETYYANRQFTDGDTWATQLGADLASGTNFAYGSATAITNGDIFPDFEAQRTEYFGAGVTLGDNPLTTVWFGGNDLRALLTPEGAGLDPVELIGGVITEIVTGIGVLPSTGLDDFLVFGLPDLGKIPSVVGTALEANVSALTTNFNMALAGALDFYYGETSPINVSFFNSQEFFLGILENADSFGITNQTDACYVADNPLTDADEFFFCGDDAASYAFFDGLHPTETGHTALAGAVRDLVTPVPLPGGLSLALGGLVLLGGVARRRKVATA